MQKYRSERRKDEKLMLHRRVKDREKLPRTLMLQGRVTMADKQRFQVLTISGVDESLLIQSFSIKFKSVRYYQECFSDNFCRASSEI